MIPFHREVKKHHVCTNASKHPSVVAAAASQTLLAWTKLILSCSQKASVRFPQGFQTRLLGPASPCQPPRVGLVLRGRAHGT